MRKFISLTLFFFCSLFLCDYSTFWYRTILLEVLPLWLVSSWFFDFLDSWKFWRLRIWILTSDWLLSHRFLTAITTLISSGSTFISWALPLWNERKMQNWLTSLDVTWSRVTILRVVENDDERVLKMIFGYLRRRTADADPIQLFRCPSSLFGAMGSLKESPRWPSPAAPRYFLGVGQRMVERICSIHGDLSISGQFRGCVWV